MTADVYLRDASWRNSIGYADKYHHESHRPDRAGLTACGAAVIHEWTAEPANSVQDSQRCMRSGCRQKWEVS